MVDGNELPNEAAEYQKGIQPYAIAILNRSDAPQNFPIDFTTLGLEGNYRVREIWQHIYGQNQRPERQWPKP